VTIRSTGIALDEHSERAGVLETDPDAASRRARIQSGTLAAIPASEMPATASNTAANTSGRGCMPPDAPALAATTIDAPP